MARGVQAAGAEQCRQRGGGDYRPRLPPRVRVRVGVRVGARVGARVGVRVRVRVSTARPAAAGSKGCLAR
eukprot:scaffold40597_cov38-Phaeocystis_antarctica.AAC.2